MNLSTRTALSLGKRCALIGAAAAIATHGAAANATTQCFDLSDPPLGTVYEVNGAPIYTDFATIRALDQSISVFAFGGHRTMYVVNVCVTSRGDGGNAVGRLATRPAGSGGSVTRFPVASVGPSAHALPTRSTKGGCRRGGSRWSRSRSSTSVSRSCPPSPRPTACRAPSTHAWSPRSPRRGSARTGRLPAEHGRRARQAARGDLRAVASRRGSRRRSCHRPLARIGTGCRSAVIAGTIRPRTAEHGSVVRMIIGNGSADSLLEPSFGHEAAKSLPKRSGIASPDRTERGGRLA